MIISDDYQYVDIGLGHKFHIVESGSTKTLCGRTLASRWTAYKFQDEKEKFICIVCCINYYKSMKGLRNKIIDADVEYLPSQQKELDQWEIDEAANIKKIGVLQTQGHTHHCACRIVWCDGECTCRKGVEP